MYSKLGIFNSEKTLARVLIVLLVLALSISMGVMISLQSRNESLSKKLVAAQTDRDNFIAEYMAERSIANTKAFTASLKPEDIHKLINAERQRNHLKDFAYNPALERSACKKAEDMISKNYWSHTDPEGGEPWKYIDSEGVLYRKAGENLGYGFKDGEELVKMWLDSPAHKANILSSEYEAEGICIKRADTFQGASNQAIIVQHFFKPL